jgi:hypothetical protein
MRVIPVLFTFLVCISACGVRAEEGGRIIASSTATRTATVTAGTPTHTPTASTAVMETKAPGATLEPRLKPEDWQEWPIIPTVMPEMKAVFDGGMASGNNKAVFIKIGDGEISTVWFLTQYDLEPANFRLGSHSDLLPVINTFSGSFGRVGLAAGRGFNTSIILGPAPAGTSGCEPGESRLACEIRTIRPAFAFISLGTNQIWQPSIFESEYRQIVKSLLEAGVVPILATKADNLEGDHRINRIITRIAYDYNLPLWNFWLAVQTLPDQGLQADLEHLTYAYSDFDNPTNMQYAWPWRNLTALQVLDAVYRAVTTLNGDEN